MEGIAYRGDIHMEGRYIQRGYKCGRDIHTEETYIGRGHIHKKDTNKGDIHTERTSIEGTSI